MSIAARPLRILAPIFVGLFCSGTLAQSAQQRAPSRADVEALVRSSLSAWENGNEELFVATAHPDLRFAYPGSRMDRTQALELFRYWRENYANTKVYINWVLVDGARFAAEFQFATTRKQDSKRSAASTVAIGEVRDGKIVLFKEYTDGRVSRLQQADQLPLDEGDEPFPWPRTHTPDAPSSPR